jgi:hypothetical protein
VSSETHNLRRSQHHSPPTLSSLSPPDPLRHTPSTMISLTPTTLFFAALGAMLMADNADARPACTPSNSTACATAVVAK